MSNLKNISEIFEVKRYLADNRDEWDSFVAKSKQGTFLFDRNYMDYHADRFLDHSLMVYRKGHLYALLPGNEHEQVFYSHQGLTYGGLLTTSKATTADIAETFKAINGYLHNQGFTTVVYKTIPWIYHELPAEEDLYALTNICNARILVRHISSAIFLNRHLPFNESRKSGIRKALRNGVEVRETNDLSAFWKILDENLENKYGAKPVHTLPELCLLKSRFPSNIRLFMAYRGNEALGGTLLYVSRQVVHTQYISASVEGKAIGVLDLLFDYLINKKSWLEPYFDFGKSSDGDGHDLNASLIFQKEGFGGRGVCYDWYSYTV